MPTRSVAEAVRSVRAVLAEAGVDGPDAELLAAWATDRSLGELRLDMAVGRALEPEAESRLADAVVRRARREPLQRIIGVAPFRHVELAVGQGVFTPRPETEVLVDVVLEHLRGAGREPLVLDVGTGSGAVAISIAREAPRARVVAVEASPAAFVWASRNVRELAPRVRLLHADARDLAALDAIGVVPGSLQVLVSNPPYVPHAAIPADPEVRSHDPALALYSGADGLDLVRSLAPLAADLLTPGGLVAFEHAEHQGAAIRGLLEDAGFHSARTRQDLAGRDRVTSAVR
ncbi:peptide chain release factor N(5)-glutamine methyltransferase [Agrococcus terreus]|uniref:peptide chain release factor N(5)-glutamine methyltransferase n=1 Tax=Agrococcus terreus TaxID=574649 RepID=UPI00166398C7|nr:peptide chain release factor N(5)-glutamine methyltransferase [Agrococcus terreus]